MKPMKAKYEISGAKDDRERKFFESIAVDIYNESAKISGVYCAGFNALIDALKDGGTEIKFNGSWECLSDMDPIDDRAYDIFCRAIYKNIACNDRFVRNGRYLQLNGIDAVRIQADWSYFTIYGEVKDL